MFEYVVTRPEIYKPRSVERTNKAQRRPYFIHANNEEEAKRLIRERYNIPISESLDVEIYTKSPFYIAPHIKVD